MLLWFCDSCQIIPNLYDYVENKLKGTYTGTLKSRGKDKKLISFKKEKIFLEKDYKDTTNIGKILYGIFNKLVVILPDF